MARDVVEICEQRVVLIDSITEVQPGDAGCVVVSGSHGGVSAAGFAVEVPARLYVFNDAGVGKDGAGIAGLALLDEMGLAALAVSHGSARIGEAADTLRHGIVASLNGEARALGFRQGEPLAAELERVFSA